MTFIPQVIDATSAFGELSVAELTPVVQLQFPYNLNTRLVNVRDNGGTASVVSNLLKVSTGAGANQSSMVLSKTSVRYSPGEGGLARFTALFESTPATNSTQWAGIGDVGDAYAFGYDGTTFNVMRRKGGVPEIRTLTISVGSDAAENITITLDGDADATVAVTNTGDTTLTANEIAAHDFSGLGQGWQAHAMGALVIFTSYNAASQTGTYSLSSPGASAGTFAQTVAGAAPTETKTAQASWNHDVMDGTGPSGMTLDHTKGNVYQIRYQWLGFGRISYYIEDDVGVGAKFILVHEVHFANANTLPSVNNPTLPLFVSVSNAANTTDMVVKVGSMAGFIEGGDADIGLHDAVSFADANFSGEKPIFTIHNHTVYQSLVNRINIEPVLLTVAVDTASAGKPATLRVRENATLTAAVFAAHDANTSVAFIDSTATAVTGGNVLMTIVVTQGAAPVLDLVPLFEKMSPGDFLTISIEPSAGNVDSVIGFTWKELL